jgi:integrase
MITALSEREVPVDRIADHVGHRDVNTTRTYRDDAMILQASPSALIWG